VTTAADRVTDSHLTGAATNPRNAPSSPVRIGTRGSALALAQARLVEEALREAGVGSELVIIETAGDRRAPDTAWGEGAFVVAIQEALLDGRVDLAIHSAKDVPTQTHPRLAIGAYLRRADPRDCLVTRADERIRTLEDLPHGARVGTDSPRRTGFLLARRPDLQLTPLHGNVDTRLRRLDEGQADALVLAVAGLSRLGRQDRIGVVLDPGVVPPAAGQGAIAVEVRADDADALRMLSAIDDLETRTAVEAERLVLELSGGGCRSPIGALGRVEDEDLVLVAGYAAPDGGAAAIEEVRGPISETAAMVHALVTSLRERVGVRPGRLRARVLVTRPAGGADEVLRALSDHAIEGVAVPGLSIEPLSPDERTALAEAIGATDWAVVTSPNGAAAVVSSLGHADLAAGGEPGAVPPPRWAAVGPETAAVLQSAGIAPVWTPSEASGRSLAAQLPIDRGHRVLLLRTPIADEDVASQLTQRGAVVRDVTAYRTASAPDASHRALSEALSGDHPVEAATFLSVSAVHGILDLAGAEHRQKVLALPAICIGPGTASACREEGFTQVFQADETNVEAVATLAARVVRAEPGGAQR
jgi:hydroxymethylbilane synthase